MCMLRYLLLAGDAWMLNSNALGQPEVAQVRHILTSSIGPLFTADYPAHRICNESGLSHGYLLHIPTTPYNPG